MDTTPLVQWAPTLRLLGLAAALAALPLLWWWLGHRQAEPRRRLAALTALTLFLTFDLIVFGAFTRLTDSGLGCPDWPGCYGEVSPFGAREEINQAQAALPSGPVTTAKAWIEMLHRYLAMVVGALILVAAVASWARKSALPHSPWWAVATLVWVLVQGLFGKYTVTLKLYPAIVTLHLLGAQVLLMLLVLQHESFRHRPVAWRGVRPAAVAVVLGVLLWQIALGGWVSTNYAVLACAGFPSCNGQWWPEAAWSAAFEVLRPLGRQADGSHLPAQALVAIHLVHRLFALVAVVALLWLAQRCWRAGGAAGRRTAGLLTGLLLLQVLSGVSNVVLGWPLLAALLHSGGAAALVGVLASLLARSWLGQQAQALPLSTGSSFLPGLSPVRPMSR